jgi:hypothetical protein
VERTIGEKTTSPNTTTFNTTDDEDVVTRVGAPAASIFSDDQLDELHRLYLGWGRKPGAIAFANPYRVSTDRTILSELDAYVARHPSLDPDHLRAAALTALNVVRSSEQRGTNGGASMLSLFRRSLDSEIARLKAGREQPRPDASGVLHRMDSRPRQPQRGSIYDAADRAWGGK